MRRTWALLSSSFVLAFVAGCSSSMSDGDGKPANAGGTTGSGTGGNVSAGGTSGTKATGGSSGASGASGASGSATGGASGGSTGGASGSSGTTGTVDCQTTEMQPTPLRRLTRFEYANTVKDLLNVDPAPANDLPADEVSNGFDNDSRVLTVSVLHAEKYVLVSEALAQAAVANVGTLTGCDPAVTGEDACAQAFAKSFGRRAFRRPTTAADEQALMTAYAAGKTGGTYAEGIEVMIRAALQSPDFLFRLEVTTPTAAGPLVPVSQFELATRLSFMLWGMAPDNSLLDAAQNGALATKEQVAAKAREMLTSEKGRIGVTNFFNQWTGVTRLAITSKNTTLFPNFDESMRAGMTAELPAFLNYVLFGGGDRKLQTLLTKPVAFISGKMGPLYGQPATDVGTTPKMVELGDAQGRSGFLTQAGFLSVQGHPDQTSPVLRGKFVRAMMLCDPPEPPPDNADTSLPTIDEGATARERFSAHSKAPACQGCHAHMDPIGFAFENFDALGQYRTQDNGQDIDASGAIYDPTDPGLEGDFIGVRQLAEKLAVSPQVTDCVATQWFRFAAGRLDAAPDVCSVKTIQSAFSGSGGDLIEMIVAVTQTDDFWNRAPVTQ